MLTRRYPATPRRWAAWLLAGALLVCAAATGCSAKKASSTVPPGVTQETISLGVLLDLTGAFAAFGKPTLQAIQLYWEERNAAGGVCGRKVELQVKDHGYNVQNAVSLYTDMKDQILAMQMLHGSPMTAALLPHLATDQMLTVPASLTPSLLDNPSIALTGTPYDLEMVNGLAWLKATKGLEVGDKIGHIYLEGEYGESALEGSQLFAEAEQVELIAQKVQPNDADLTAQVTALAQAGVRLVALSTSPAQTASAVGVAHATGLDMTFMGSTAAFTSSLLEGVARQAIEQRLFISMSYEPFSSTAPAATQVRGKYKAKYPNESYNISATSGTGSADMMRQILEKACEVGDPNRENLRQAFHSLQLIDTGGLLPPLDFSQPGQPPARQNYITRPDALTEGGLSVVQPRFAAPLAENYRR